MTHQSVPHVRVREMRTEELGFAAHEHLQHFPEGFFARLGQHFLQEYYGTFLTSPHARLLVAEDEDGLVGYVAGVMRPSGHRAHVLAKHRWSLIAKGLFSLVRKPSLLYLFVRTRSRIYARKLIRRKRTVATSGDRTAPAVLSHIVVDPGRHCQGIGRQLILALMADACTAGCSRMVLVTEFGNASENFYRHLQWVEDGTHQTLDGRTVIAFHRDICAASDGESAAKGFIGGN